MTARPLLSRGFVLVALSTLAYMLAVGAVLPVLPLFVEDDLGGGSLSVGIVVGSFAVAGILCRPLIGHFGDSRGRRWMIVVGSLLSAVAVAGYSVVPAVPVLVLLRLVFGVGQAAFFVGTATMIADLAPDDRRAEALSYYSLSVYSGLAAGPVLGETLLQERGFAAVWAVAAVLSLAAAGLAALAPDARGVSEDPATRRLAHPAGLGPGAVLGLGLLGFAGFTTFVPLYAPDIGLSGSRFIFLVYGVIVLLFRSLGARIPDRLGHVRSATAATFLTAAGLATIAAWATPTGLYTGTVLLSFGSALLFPALLSMAVAGAPESERASVVATFTAFFDISQGFGALLLGGVAAVAGYRGAFAAGAVGAAAGMLLLFALNPRRPATTGTTGTAEEAFTPA